MGTKGIQGDYTSFVFNNVPTEELGITRVSNGDRYEMNLLPEFESKTVDVPGGDGTYYFGSFYKNRKFSFNLAYDGVTEQNLRQMQQLFGDRRVHPLIFDEYPFKTYYAKVESSPSFEYVVFDEGDSEYEAYIWTHRNAQLASASGSERIYKGEATIEFICYEPFGYCSHKFLEDSFYQTIAYSQNKDEWAPVSGLKENLNGFDELIVSGESETEEYHIQVYNPGDLPAPFKLFFNGNTIPAMDITLIDEDNQIYSLKLKEIIPKEGDNSIVYDSKLHLIYGIDELGEKTGTIYNEFIESGDFFDIPQTDPWKENLEGENYVPDTAPGLSLVFSTNPGEVSIEYDYIYF